MAVTNSLYEAKKSVFLGYTYGKKGWRVYDSETGLISVSRDVVFSEKKFPFATLPSHDLDESSFQNQIFVNPLADDIEIHDSSRVESLSMETNDSQSENELLLNMKNLTIDGFRRAFSIRFSLVRW